MSRTSVLKMVNLYAQQVGLEEVLSPYSFCGTSIKVYLEKGCTIANVQVMANCVPSRTTKLYDRTGDQVSPGEIERIVI